MTFILICFVSELFALWSFPPTIPLTPPPSARVNELVLSPALCLFGGWVSLLSWEYVVLRVERIRPTYRERVPPSRSRCY